MSQDQSTINANSSLAKKIDEFKRSYHKKLLITGLLGFLIISSLLTTTILSIEYVFWLSSPFRTIIFFTFILLTVFLIWRLVIVHIIPLSRSSKRISDEFVAEEVGSFFPTIADKFLNFIQLRNDKNSSSSLQGASLIQKSEELKNIPFRDAIEFQALKKYSKILATIFLVILVMGISSPKLFTDSSRRLLNYNSEFIKEAPFSFEIDKPNWVFHGEKLDVELTLEGKSFPGEVYLQDANRRYKMSPVDDHKFRYSFSSVKNDLEFLVDAGGVLSNSQIVPVVYRPELIDFQIVREYPSHVKLVSDTVDNIGSFTIPEGTEITWILKSLNAEEILLTFDDSTRLSDASFSEQTRLSTQILESSNYDISLKNEYGSQKERLSYTIETISDKYPELDIEFIADTILYEFVIISGNVSDDYGIRSIEIESTILGEKSRNTIHRGDQNQKSFYEKIELDENQVKNISEVQFQVIVTDNDAINSYKSSRSPLYNLILPNSENLESRLSKKSENTEKQLEESIEKSESLNEKLEDIEERLRSKKELEWQEEKLLEEILNQKSEIQKSIEELQNQFDDLRKNEDKFGERSQNLQEKAMKLQELMNEILDEETRKMYSELQKLLEEKNLPELQNQISQMRPNTEDMEEELERALELFKRLKVETALEKASNELDKLADKQNELAKESESKTSENENLKDQQEKIQEEFEEIQEKMDNIQEMNQDLENPEPLENTSQEEQEIQQEMEKAGENLKKGDNKSGSQNQKKAGSKMKQLSQKMQQMQANMEMEMMTENVQHLQNILDDLIKISYKQESLILDFRQVQQVDPRFVELSQEQLKLKDDAKVLEDSLLALANRVTQISSFVTRELTEVNRNIDQAVQHLKDRNRSKALGSQQYSMTAINNLALLLDDVLQQMQMSMSEGMGKGKPQKGQKGDLPNMKQLQEQLSQKIKDLKQSGQQGRKLSESLAKMAAEQEMLRNQLQKLQEQLAGNNDEAAGNLGKALKEMEQNEVDLVNKRLTQQLINRQDQIMTRLLQAENAMREQELDDEREGESAQNYDQNLPKVFEEYLKAREKEIELLKSVPLDLSPFYKKEVNDYFRRISNLN